MPELRLAIQAVDGSCIGGGGGEVRKLVRGWREGVERGNEPMLLVCKLLDRKRHAVTDGCCGTGKGDRRAACSGILVCKLAGLGPRAAGSGEDVLRGRDCSGRVPQRLRVRAPAHAHMRVQRVGRGGCGAG